MAHALLDVPGARDVDLIDALEATEQIGPRPRGQDEPRIVPVGPVGEAPVPLPSQAPSRAGNSRYPSTNGVADGFCPSCAPNQERGSGWRPPDNPAASSAFTPTPGFRLLSRRGAFAFSSLSMRFQAAVTRAASSPGERSSTAETYYAAAATARAAGRTRGRSRRARARPSRPGGSPDLQPPRAPAWRAPRRCDRPRAR